MADVPGPSVQHLCLLQILVPFLHCAENFMILSIVSFLTCAFRRTLGGQLIRNYSKTQNVRRKLKYEGRTWTEISDKMLSLPRFQLGAKMLNLSAGEFRRFFPGECPSNTMQSKQTIFVQQSENRNTIPRQSRLVKTPVDLRRVKKRIRT